MLWERRADLADIDRLVTIRSAVRENRLSAPDSVTREEYEAFIRSGQTWVGGLASQIAGFSASDVRDGSIWALFVDPGFQGRGIGPSLLHRACQDLKAAGHRRAWLTTGSGTRAARMYASLGWTASACASPEDLHFALVL